MINYSYPRVNISSKATKHSNIATPETEDTTVLFMPLKTEKGQGYEVTPVHSLAEFTQTFGSLEYAYAENGQAALNTYNWLVNGGTVYVCRLTSRSNVYYKTAQIKYYKFNSETQAFSDPITEECYKFYNSDSYYFSSTSNVGKYVKLFSDKELDGVPVYYYTLGTTELYDYEVLASSPYPTTASGVLTFGEFTVDVEALYEGTYYNNITLRLDALGSRTFDKVNCLFNLTISKGPSVLEKFYRISLPDVSSVADDTEKAAMILEALNNVIKSEYITIKAVNMVHTDLATESAKKYINMTISGAEDVDGSTDDMLKAFWTKVDNPGKPTVYELLGNKLETPIDLFLDAGYPVDVKNAMYAFVNQSVDSENLRHDIVLILDAYYHNTETGDMNRWDDIDGITGINIAFYDQYFKVNNIFDSGKEVYVGPSYFLAKLLPYNDLQYGIQWATAGIRRGVLDDAIWVNSNPLPSEKQSLFDARINYVEKTSREYAFMSQRTHTGETDGEYTALSFLNNVRAFYKMQKELERLGREYLYEFNDSITLANLSNVLNRYMSQWVSNRTLAYANIDVRKNSLSDEAVDIIMSIKFTGTIEVISIDITID